MKNFNKKKIFAVLFVILVVYLVGMTAWDKISYSKLSVDEKILVQMNYDEMEGTMSVDNLIWKTEVEDGYFCVAVSSEEGLVNFGYIRNNNSKLEFAGKSFSNLPMIVYNEDPTLFQRTSILNFSEKDFYYGCYQHNDNLKVIVNDSETEIYNFTLNYSGKDFNMDFWFVCSENEPTVEIV